MSRNTKNSAALVALFVLAIGILAIAAGGREEEQAAEAPATTTTQATATATPEAAEAAETSVLVAADPQLLGRAGRDGVTFTEFLDFECESCGAAFPAIERLRQAYAGRVTFSVRYFPLPGHQNSRNAAHAVEAAHQQGKFEEMYKRMFESQLQWGDKGGDFSPLFRSFAEDLDLDMKQFDADVASEETAARVQRDVDAGAALGVQSTPTFFINEELIRPSSFDELRQLLDQALAET